MKKILKSIIFLSLILTLTGCTVQLKDVKTKKVVINEETGQAYTKNVLCKSTKTETQKVYEKQKVDIKKLPECKNLKINSGNYEGIWESFFVKPLAYLLVVMGSLVKNYGISIIIVTFLIRLCTYPFTKKSAMQSEKMKLAKPDLDKLEKKYANKQDQDSKLRKTQEMQEIYKKYNINPMSGCLFAFIQIPLFFAFYEAINRLPILFEEELFGFRLGMTPKTAVLEHGQWLYLIFVILVIAASYLSTKLNPNVSMSQDQEKQMKKMSNMMVLVIGVTSNFLAVGIALYWISNNTFTIIQNLIVRRGKKNVKDK